MRASQTFGQYEILERVSVGGMAQVFRARHRTRGTIVALKRVLPEVAEDDEAMQMFEDEARICVHLDHPHIARMLDYGHVDDAFFIAFEFVHGKDLRFVFDRAARTGTEIPLSVLLYIFTRIGEGLAYAHARKDVEGAPVSIVHRDVSPQNIVLSFDGDVKLIDFGIAKGTGRLSRTGVGSIKGKFGYMSPEQVRGEEVDAQTDVFSLGICMWELLTRQRLFSGPNELIVLEKIKNLDIVPPSQVVGRLPPELDRIVLKALANKTAQRYRAAKDLYRDLNIFCETHDFVATRDEIAQYMRRTFPETSGRDVASRSSSPSFPPLREPVHGRAQESSRTAVRRNDEEMMNMAAEKQGGSDLDIFEGLGKKNAPQRESAPPPPPSSMKTPAAAVSARPSSPPPQVVRGDLAIGKKTLLGVQAPPTSAPPPAPRSSQPMRASLPAVTPPPQKNLSQPVPPAADTKPVAYAENAVAASAKPNAVSMDWDDDEEATHVLDREEDKAKRPPSSSRMPAARASGPTSSPTSNPGSNPVSSNRTPARPSQPPPLPREAPRSSVRPNTGLSAPPPPPPPPSAGFRSAPPVQAVSQQVAQMAQPAGSFPPPSQNQSQNQAQNHAQQNPFQMPVQTNTAPMGMPGMNQPGPQSGPPRPQSVPPSLPPVQSAPQIQLRTMSSRLMEETQIVRPTQNRGMWIAIGIGLLVAVAAAIALVPRTSKLAINVVDGKGATVNRVDLFVDGKKECETSPCIVDLSSGAHEVKALAQGFDPASRAIILESRKDATTELVLSGGKAVAGTTGIKAPGNQAGVKLSVDGKEIGQLPQEVGDLTPGDHKIRLSGDRYETLEKNVTVVKDEMQDLGPLTLKVVKGKATITLGTTGAKVYLVSGSDRRDLPTFPISVDIDTSKSWTLEAMKAGFADYKQPISFADGQAEKTFDVELSPKGAAGSTVAAFTPASTPAVHNTAPSTPKPPKPDTSTSDSSSGSTAAASGGDATLNINSLPASAVVLDGKPLGQTPQLKITVPAGDHTVTFINSDQGLKKTMKITVGAGETKPVIAKLKSE